MRTKKQRAGRASGAAEVTSPGTRRAAVLVVGKERFRVGDDVLVKVEKSKTLAVARIKALRGDSEDVKATEVDVQWYYKPEDTPDGKKEYHGAQEVFWSDHRDWVPAASISSRATVLTLEDYEALDDEEEETDFYCRYTYQLKTKKFLLRGAKQAHCSICEEVYCPDLDWLTCRECRNGFHPDCVGLHGPAAVDAVREDYVCSFCTTSKKKRKL